VPWPQGVASRLAAAPKRATVFVVWGKTEEQAQQALERLRAAGAVRRTDNVSALAWPGPEPLPLSRRTDVQDLSQKNLISSVPITRAWQLVMNARWLLLKVRYRRVGRN
jgi:hypothetical protein